MATVNAWVAPAAKQKLVRQQIDLGPLGPEEVEVEVENSGLCHSDISMLNNDWGFSSYPLVLGHEVIGRVVAVGPAAKGITVGQRVGIGWTASQLHALPAVPVGRSTPLPPGACRRSSATAAVSPAASARIGPGRSRCPRNSTLPTPARCCVAASRSSIRWRRYAKPTSRVGIVGIGGLGHMGVKFAAAFGCDVTAFTSSESKFDEARSFGASHVVSSSRFGRDQTACRHFRLVDRDGERDARLGGDDRVACPQRTDARRGSRAGADSGGGLSIDLLAARAFPARRRGSPVAIETMLDFAARHDIAPHDRAFPDEPDQRSFRSARGRQSPLPYRARCRLLKPIRELPGTVPILRSPRSKMGLSPAPRRFSDRLSAGAGRRQRCKPAL